MTNAERLERIAHLVYEWGDMMTDGPDDSDVGLAESWLIEAFGLAREHRRELGASGVNEYFDSMLPKSSAD